MNEISNLLTTALACHERKTDMRLNPTLSESDVVETIRIAIECIEGLPPPKHIIIPLPILARFTHAVEELFKGDANWSLWDVDGAREFYEACDMIPNPAAVAVE